MSLLDYGFDLLENRDDLIENFNFKDPYDFVNELFEDAYVNQSLTYNRCQAADDVFMEYDIVDILETLNNMGYDNESIRNFSIEAIHVYYVQINLSLIFQSITQITRNIYQLSLLIKKYYF
ncbi:hypothetical protein G6Z86_07065 (plasmid) [Lactobacillus iners]|uniref:hypothetical protein n=1 Tax=Lactobacillus iners TaxID=147802 RepID=UPI0013E1D0E0|nr:hypothetical protein [Lactobacillus iners]QIH28330.1 hypothetical protein G6Z86_07065 [Lactobacillus iners]